MIKIWWKSKIIEGKFYVDVVVKFLYVRDKKKIFESSYRDVGE